jgi:hypothetical protein
MEIQDVVIAQTIRGEVFKEVSHGCQRTAAEISGAEPGLPG